MAIHITIDDQVLEVEEGLSILEAARQNGIHIPTLCYLKELDPQASCRICVVEVEGARTFIPSCATKVREGMVVRTNTEEVRANRKRTLEMIMAHHPVDCHHCLRLGSSKEEDLAPKFCEMCFWCDCVRDGICELQKLNREYHVDKLPFDVEEKRYEVDKSLGSVIRDDNKCVKCRRCIDVCNNIQCVHNLALFGRGQDYRVTASMDKSMKESLCVRCGRCVDVCPTGALHMNETIDKMLFYAHSYSSQMFGMVSSSVLPELEKLNNMEEGTLDGHKLIAAMKKLGIDCVISEEEIIDINQTKAEEIIRQATGQVIMSNSFSAKNFVDTYYPNLKDKVIYYESLQETFAKRAKELASQFGFDVDELKTVVFTGNNENGAEVVEKGSVDFSMNARELYRTFMRTGVDLKRMNSADGLKMNLDKEHIFDAVTAPVCFNYEKEPEILKIDGKLVAIAHNLGQAKKLLDGVEAGISGYDVIRICG
ncbi:Periplasmic [Fe] hydrogenase large subunit [Lachnospiraceae bacterium TWA4]|nr:Periplasmic [Fe] hydrogenase large subunit [Lachnospiraceae bacterium TWA4]